MPGVTRGLGDHVKHDRLQILQPEITEEIGPPGWGSIHRSSGDDVVRTFYFPPVAVEHGVDWNLGADLPGVGRGLSRVIGLADESSYRIRLSQEVIGDALGLSLPYVNRILRRLSDDGLVTIREHRFMINDVEALAALADFERNYLRPMPLAEFSDAPR